MLLTFHVSLSTGLVHRTLVLHQCWVFLNPRILTLQEQDFCCHIRQYCLTSFVKTNGDLLSVYYPGHRASGFVR
jgi:hypothetical protein